MFQTTNQFLLGTENYRDVYLEGILKIYGDPHVTVVSILMTWMIWGCPHRLETSPVCIHIYIYIHIIIYVDIYIHMVYPNMGIHGYTILKRVVLVNSWHILCTTEISIHASVWFAGRSFQCHSGLGTWRASSLYNLPGNLWEISIWRDWHLVNFNLQKDESIVHRYIWIDRWMDG